MSRAEFFENLSKSFGLVDLKRIQNAYWFSKNVHRPQKRDSGERYFEHPLRVAKILINSGYNSGEQSVSAIVTAFLHDVVEDTYTPQEVMIDLFGPEIWFNVSTLSKSIHVLDPLTLELITSAKKDTKIYYERIADANKAVRLVKIADRLDNIQDLHKFEATRKEKYIKETTEFILPIARNTEPVIEKEIINILKSQS